MKKEEIKLIYGETQIRLPFAIGDVVYFMEDNEVVRDTIESIELNIKTERIKNEDKTVADGIIVFDSMPHEDRRISFSKIFKSESDLLKSISIDYQYEVKSLYNLVGIGVKEPNKNKPMHIIISGSEFMDN